MRLRPPVVSLSFAASLMIWSLGSGCRQEPAATIKEVNDLDVKSAEAPNPVEDPRFKDFFDRVREYLKIHNAADARVPSLKETSDPKLVYAREKALADELRVERANARQGDVFSPSAAREIGAIVAADFKSRPNKDQKAILIEV